MPVLWEHLQGYWDAFLWLGARRSSNGFGPNPIPSTEIEAYAGREGFDDLREFVTIIAGLDETFLASTAKKD